MLMNLGMMECYVVSSGTVEGESMMNGDGMSNVIYMSVARMI